MEEGYSIERIHELTKIDSWFLSKLKNIVDYKVKLSTYNKITTSRLIRMNSSENRSTSA
ncbi:hypothetical protein [Bilophila wadsworthia]|uniref:hypothetical protein n=1 Tax=Bilophila wadsworthia TaxID=35833 RepID=UPI003AB76ACB